MFLQKSFFVFVVLFFQVIFAEIETELCSDPAPDTLLTEKGKTYIFKNGNYYKQSGESIEEGYPKRIADEWPGLESKLDAAFVYNDKTFFFKGSRYWRYTDRTLDSGYPKEIKNRFPGIPNDLDTAMVYGNDNHIYFFKGDKYWKYDPLRDPPIESSYPRAISQWKGVPDDLDAAIKWPNGRTFFLKGDKYWRFDDDKFEVDQNQSPPYPWSNTYWWYGCPGARRHY